MTISDTGGQEPIEDEGRTEHQEARQTSDSDATGSDDDGQSQTSTVSGATQSSLTSHEPSTGSEDLQSSPSSSESRNTSPDIDAFLGPESPPAAGVLTTFKIVGDNIDKNVKPRDMRSDYQTRSLHYFHAYAVRDRLNLDG